MVYEKIRTCGKVGFGYNAYTEDYVDMIASGIVDPTKVTRSSLENAASIAGCVLTTESLVVDKPDPAADAAAAAAAGGACSPAFPSRLRSPQRAAGDLQIIRVQLAQRLSAVAAAAETAKALRSVQPREIRLRIPAGKLARVLGDKAHLLFLARAPLALTPGQLTHRPLVSGAFAPQSRRLESAIVLMALRRGSAVPLLRRAVLRGRHDLPDLFRSFVFVHLGLLSAGVRPGPRIPLR